MQTYRCVCKAILTFMHTYIIVYANIKRCLSRLASMSLQTCRRVCKAILMFMQTYRCSCIPMTMFMHAYRFLFRATSLVYIDLLMLMEIHRCSFKLVSMCSFTNSPRFPCKLIDVYVYRHCDD